MVNKINVFKQLLILFVLLFATSTIKAFDPEEKGKNAAEASSDHEEKFSAGKFIIDHVTDKYEWHITGSEEHPVSVPLPVILYSKGNGLSVFLSSKFEHGKASYEGYTLNEAGHIEREDEAQFYDFSITKAVAGILLATILVLWIFISVAKAYTRRKGMAPKGFSREQQKKSWEIALQSH